VINTMLLGTTYVQTCIYFGRNKDATLFHGVVLAVITFDTLDTGLIATTMYYYFLVNFGNYTALESVPDTMWLEFGTTSVVTATYGKRWPIGT